jgi:hypothetical protein
MKITLHNPAHNGDVLFSSKLVEIIIKNNPSYHFIISPSCSTILFEHLVSDSVELQINPYEWEFEKNNISNNDNYLVNQQNILWSMDDNGNLYINMWILFSLPQNTCMNILDRIEFTKKTFEDIENKTTIKLQLELDNNNYKQLISKIPQFDISFIYSHIFKPIYKKRIFFYNLMGQSKQEVLPPTFNNEYIKQLLHENKDSIVIVPDTTTIKDDRLISLMDNFNIQKEISGKSLVIYANICNICDEVHFKNNGGSLFTLNVENIENKNVKYFYLNQHDIYYNIMKNCYNLNIVN